MQIQKLKSLIKAWNSKTKPKTKQKNKNLDISCRDCLVKLLCPSA